ncbi:MAG: glycosyltransferase family 4 protein [Acidobacteria bacterium]|nr:glycosyltransferase family 4 protein [Acidobacteriota bacterium]
MRILVTHNRYRQAGGEDEVVRREIALLEREGHEVAVYSRSNEEIADQGNGGVGRALADAFLDGSNIQPLRDMVRSFRPNVAHFHNTFHRIPPVAYEICRQSGACVVQTVHNPRLLCPAATFWRSGGVCTDCVGSTMKLPAIRHRCYHASVSHTVFAAGYAALLRRSGVIKRAVDLYIFSTRFYRQIFAEAGWPADRTIVKPHFLPDHASPQTDPGKHVLYVGRIAPEKGTPTIFRAWEGLAELPLVVRGDGGEGAWQPQEGVSFRGRLAEAELGELFRGARFLIWPSEGFYESFGLVAIEAFSYGIPVLASDTGVSRELVTEGQTGLFFKAGDSNDLSRVVRWAWEHPKATAAMGQKARSEFLRRYTAEANYPMLLDCYEKALSQRRTSGIGRA